MMLMCLSIAQADIDRRVLISAVDINGKFQIHAVSSDILMHLIYHLVMLINQVYIQTLIMLMYYNL